MCILEDFILNLQEFLICDKRLDHNIIRKHTKKLDELGDISFPTNISNWYQFIDIKNIKESELITIFNYIHRQIDTESVIHLLIEKSSNWNIQIKNCIFRNNDTHIFIKKSSILYSTVIKEVLNHDTNYGSCDVIKNNVYMKIGSNVDTSLDSMDLSTLRVIILKDTATNFVNYSSCKSPSGTCDVVVVSNPVGNSCSNILCGPVLNEKGVKTTCRAQELYQKRSSDMRMMAQHKYGVQVKPNTAWENYFNNLGKSSVIMEMLTNKPQKSIKLNLNDLQSANKGASFVFYNCARLAALFKEFEKRVSIKEYPNLPDVELIDFSLLNQPNPKEHIFSVIHARIYLLKALQCVFHNALRLLSIEPIREM